jgi:phosphoribosyl 1,2-cyclic phosphodiesterase
MKIKLWGVRGSIPSPGPHTVRYGGNTTCIEVRSDDDSLIILDAGTGIFPLAQSLLTQLPITANIFFTHTHWGHIQGLPFFVPLYIPGNTVRIHGAYDIVSMQGIEQVMAVQMQYCFFPIREAELRAGIEYKTVTIGEPVAIGTATMTPVLMNHPVTGFGYRVECNGKSMFFTGDHEPWINIYAEDDHDHAEYQAMIDQHIAELDAAIGPVDLLICDTTYTLDEYPTRIGWGHGTFDHAIAMARRIGAQQLICTHHEATRSDDDLEKVFAEALARQPKPGCKVMLAREGLEIVL